MPPSPTLPSPSQSDIMAQLVTAAAGTVNGPEFGFVLSYNATTQRAIVQPVAKLVYMSDNEKGWEYQEQPAFADVPVAWPVTSSGALTMPIAANDRVLLVPASRSLDEYKQTGDSQITQQDLRRHAMQDCIAIPMNVLPLAAAQWAANAVVLQGGDVRLGSSLATSPVALATPTNANFSSLQTLLTATAAIPSTTTEWAAFIVLLNTFLATGWPQSTSATNVKAL